MTTSSKPKPNGPPVTKITSPPRDRPPVSPSQEREASPRDNLPAPAPNTLRDFLRMESVKKRFEEVLGAKAPLFIANLATYVYATPALRDCDHQSFLAAALTSAALDLPIDRNLGYACIVPYNDNKTGRILAQFQMMGKGYIQLAHRTGQYQNIHVAEVYDGEIRKVNHFTGEITFGERLGPESQITGYLAYFKLMNGFEKFLYMTLAELRAHGKRYSRGYDNPRSKWQTDPETMYQKTPLKLLLKRYGVLSVEMQRAMQAEIPPDELEPEPPGEPPNGNGNGNGHPAPPSRPAPTGSARDETTGAGGVHSPALRYSGGLEWRNGAPGVAPMDYSDPEQVRSAIEAEQRAQDQQTLFGEE